MFSLKNLMTIFVNKPHSFFIPMQVMAYLFFHEGIQTQNFRYRNDLSWFGPLRLSLDVWGTKTTITKKLLFESTTKFRGMFLCNANHQLTIYVALKVHGSILLSRYGKKDNRLN